MSGLQWYEPIEGLEFGEIYLGGMASTYLSRGWSTGYAVFFTDKRAIGVRMGNRTRALLLPYSIAIASLYILAIFFIKSELWLIVLFPLVVWVADTVLRFVARKLAERVISRWGADAAKLMKRKRDFEFRRNDIEELLMQNVGRGLSLGRMAGYLKITPKDHSLQSITIKIHRWNESERLRDLVINFSSREPKVKALEYPPS